MPSISPSQRIVSTVVYKALDLGKNSKRPFFAASSSDSFTLDHFSEALPHGCSLPGDSSQLNFSTFVGDPSAQHSPSFFAGEPIDRSQALFAEYSSDAFVFIDARADAPIPRHLAAKYQLPQLAKARKQLSAFVDNEEPGYLDICDWGPLFWCLYAHVMAKDGKAAVLLSEYALDDYPAAQALLVRTGLIEKVYYLTLRDEPSLSRCALFILSPSNKAITFSELNPHISVFNTAWFDEPLDDAKLDHITQFSATHSARDLLKAHCLFSLNAIKLMGIKRGYPSNLGQLFVRVPPFMQRESTQSSDIDAIPVRKISSRDFSDGLLLPSSAIESRGFDEPDGELRISPRMFERYGLRSGDIVAPRLLGRGGFTNMLVIDETEAAQHLVASHNATVLRPRCESMTDEERVAYSEMMAAYLTSGHGAQIIDALADGVNLKSLRPSDLEKIEVPPALDYRTAEYGENANNFVELYNAKKDAETALAQAHRDLDGARGAIAENLKKLSNE